jgi:hypothetical protein
MPKLPQTFPATEILSNAGDGVTGLRVVLTAIAQMFQRIAAAFNNPDFGPTSARPADQLTVGQVFFDSTLDGPVWWDGSGWVTGVSGSSGINQLTGDILAGPGTGSVAATLPNVNGNVGTFQGLTVNAKGQVTAASNQGYLTGNQTVTLSGDVTGSGATAITATLANTTVTPGSYTLSSITVDSKGRITAASNGSAGSGTVTSVALTVPTELSVSGSPVTTAGTLAVTWATETANLIFAGPPSGGAVAPTFRSMVAADLPATAVTPASYTNTNLTVDQQGRITAASNGSTPTLVAPQGRLTLTTGTPVMRADVTAATTIYYDTFIGNKVPVGGTLLTIGSDEISMGLDAGVPHAAANTVYDIFGINNSGTLVIAVGPAWINTATVTTTVATPCVVTWNAHGLSEGSPVVFTGAGLPSGIVAGTTYFVGRSPAANTFNISTTVANAAAGTFVNTTGTSTGTQTGTNGTTKRGTGAGTTELVLNNGVWTNANSLTHAWGGASGTTDYGTVSANAGTYLGSVYITANGQTAMQFKPAGVGGGSNNILGLYNAYNSVAVRSQELDSTANWTYNSTTWRAANGNVNNRITWLDGLGTRNVDGTYQTTFGANTATSTLGNIGVLFDNTNSTPLGANGVGACAATNIFMNPRGNDNFTALGLHYVQAAENSGLATSKYFGAGNYSLLLSYMN